MPFRSILLHAFLALLCTGPGKAQVLIDHVLLDAFTVEELQAQGVTIAEYPIEVHRLRYATVDPFGNATIASGAVVLPIAENCYHALAAYLHGTILDREDVPSRQSQEIVVGHFLGASGYVGVLPDYLGLGDSPGMHPYVHAASEASASIDMLRATREFCAARGVQLNGQLFLTGYSQGGHACMATHQAIQAHHSDEFQVTASAPCSGPYDVSGVQAQAMVDTVPYPAPYYLPYVLFAYGHVYPDLYADISEVLQEPWATLLPPLFEGNNGSGAVDAVMPNVPSQILQDSVLQAFRDDPDHPFRVALRDNDVYDWAPQAPVRLIYCEADGHVFFENSLVAYGTMVGNGAPSVLHMSAGAGLDHGDCALPALLSAKFWFDQMKAPCSWNGVEDAYALSWSMHPNPSTGDLWLQRSDGYSGTWRYRLLQADGRTAFEGGTTFVNGSTHLVLPVLPEGLYVLAGEQGRGGPVWRVVLE